MRSKQSIVNDKHAQMLMLFMHTCHIAHIKVHVKNYIITVLTICTIYININGILMENINGNIMNGIKIGVKNQKIFKNLRISKTQISPP